MLIYAGIDEAGYGPMFGPFVVGRTVFAVDEYDGVQLPCLWRALNRAVCRKPSDKRRRIAVNDSKVLYSPQTGLGHLERAVLGFGRLMDRHPAHVDEYLAAIAADAASAQPALRALRSRMRTLLRWAMSDSCRATTRPASISSTGSRSSR